MRGGHTHAHRDMEDEGKLRVGRGEPHLRGTRPEAGAWKADAEAQKRQMARKRSIKLLDLEMRILAATLWSAYSRRGRGGDGTIKGGGAHLGTPRERAAECQNAPASTFLPVG